MLNKFSKKKNVSLIKDLKNEKNKSNITTFPYFFLAEKFQEFCQCMRALIIYLFI